MEKLIRAIFEEYHYEPMGKEEDGILKFQLIDNSKSDFYICCTCDGGEDLKQICEKIEEDFANGAYYSNDERDPTFAKNTSIIYLVKVDDVEIYEEQNQNMIYDIEESPYFLKKYVLVYNIDQVQQFNSFMSEMDDSKLLSINEKMAEIISNSYYYDKSGKKIQEATLYSFVLKLYAKLPFTIYDVEPEPRISETLQLIEDEIAVNSDELVTKLFSEYNGVLWKKEDLVPLADEIEITVEEIDDYISEQLMKLEGE